MQLIEKALVDTQRLARARHRIFQAPEALIDGGEIRTQSRDVEVARRIELFACPQSPHEERLGLRIALRDCGGVPEPGGHRGLETYRPAQAIEDRFAVPQRIGEAL